MKISSLHKSTSKLEVSDETKQGLLEIIDLKTDSNTDKILERLDSLEKTLSLRMDSMDKRMDNIDKRMDDMDRRIDKRIYSTEKSLKYRIAVLQWLVATMTAATIAAQFWFGINKG